MTSSASETLSMTTDDVTRRGYSVSIYIRVTKMSFRPTAKQRSCVDGGYWKHDVVSLTAQVN